MHEPDEGVVQAALCAGQPELDLSTFAEKANPAHACVHVSHGDDDLHAAYLTIHITSSILLKDLAAFLTH